jgi:hypothetical protein
MSYAWSRQHDAMMRGLVGVGYGTRHIANCLGRTPQDVEERFKLLRLERQLGWQYGTDRASRILEGSDPASEDDLAAWNALGSRRAAA